MAFSKDLQDEVNYLLDLREEALEAEGEAFDRTSDEAVYDALTFIEDAGGLFFKQHCRAIRLWQIQRGVYEVMSAEEVANTTTTRGTVWDFRMDGLPYKFRKHIGGTR